MATEAPGTTMHADVESELRLLRQQNKELQSQLKQLRGQLNSPAGKCENGGVQTQDIVNLKSNSTPLQQRRSSHEDNFNDEEDISKHNSLTLSPSVHKAKHSYTDLTHCEEKLESITAPPLSPKLNSSNKSSNIAGFSTPKQSNRKKKHAKDGNGSYKQVQVLEIDEENLLPPALPGESIDANDSESDEMDDDSSHNKHQNRRRVRGHAQQDETFWHDIKERAGWLIGLLFLQSCSSFIIQYNEQFLQGHMVIVQFLTMLVGAGGNAGNQSSVRVIRGLAVGSLNDRTIRPFLKQEIKMAFGLSALLGLTGFIRAALFRTPAGETVAVTTSLCAIVLISVGIGNMLPLGMKRCGIDPAHSSTTIQVVMDIMGVLITVCVSSFVLSFRVFQHADSTNTTSTDDTVL